MKTRPDPYDDIRYLLNWLTTGLIWLGVIVTINAVERGLEGRWVLMTITGLFGVYLFVSVFLAARRADRYVIPSRRRKPKAVVPSRYKTEETP